MKYGDRRKASLIARLKAERNRTNRHVSKQRWTRFTNIVDCCTRRCTSRRTRKSPLPSWRLKKHQRRNGVTRRKNVKPNSLSMHALGSIDVYYGIARLLLVFITARIILSGAPEPHAEICGACRSIFCLPCFFCHQAQHSKRVSAGHGRDRGRKTRIDLPVPSVSAGPQPYSVGIKRVHGTKLGSCQRP